MTRILIALPTGHNAANLLHTGVIERVLADASTRLLLVSPLVRDPAFVAELPAQRVDLFEMRPHIPDPIERVTESLLAERYLRTSGLVAPRLQRDRARLLRGRSGVRFLFTMKNWLGALPVPASSWRRAARSVERERPYRGLFEKFRPEVVLTCSAGFLDAEVPLIREAQRWQVPQMSVDLGWDNLSSKYRPLYRLDRLLVWNDSMGREAIAYHGYQRDAVEATGAPQFDAYFSRGQLPPREEFFNSIGADPRRRLVTLATAGKGTYPSTTELVKLLAEGARGANDEAEWQLLVRMHPRDDPSPYDELNSLPGVILDRRMREVRAPEGFGVADARFPSRHERAHLAATLAHSDVLVNFASTTTIEACIFDTPVVNIGFDSQEGLPLPLSIRRYLHYEHYQPVLASGAVRIAKSQRELLDQVREYLRHPEQDAVGRAVVVRSLAGPSDGRAATRVGDAILRFAERSVAPRIALSPGVPVPT